MYQWQTENVRAPLKSQVLPLIFYKLGEYILGDAALRKVASGRQRKLTSTDDRYIILKVRDRNQTLDNVAQQFRVAAERQAQFSVVRQLGKDELFARRPDHWIRLTASHRWYYLQWCQEHRLNISSVECDHQLINGEVVTVSLH
ncbi:hypothetical protein TNCV_1500151 [Trichonephila clavipes]|nr:hypothetical protein TNCV_1500151 [Trichonephila clavipes]